MKIIMLGTAHPLRGGLASFNERLCAEFQSQGHSVAIYSFSLQYPSFLFPGKTQYSEDAAPEHLSIKTIVNSINPFNWIKVGLMLQKEKPDLVLVKFWIPFMGPCFGTILRIAKWNKHTKVISILDNVIPHEKRFGDIIFTKYFLKAIDAFVSMSQEVLKDLKTFSNKPALYTPHPLYDNYGSAISKAEAIQRLGLDTDKRYILFFGFIRKYKGLDWLLEAMNHPDIKQQNIKLIIAGEFYSDEAIYTELIHQYQLQEKVELFTQFIPNSEVRNYFCAADLVVQPYKTATQSGITQIAYHFEKPMIVTNVGGLAENVPDGKVGFVVAPNPDAIAEAILQFYAPNALPNFTSDIQIEKKKYSWEIFTQKILSLI